MAAGITPALYEKAVCAEVCFNSGGFDSLARMPRMAMAFIEMGFFGEAVIGCLERLHKLCPQLRIVLFIVSGIQPDETARYVHWSGGGFISLRDRPERIEGRLKALFEGREFIPDDVLRDMGDYDRPAFHNPAAFNASGD
jgi:DNA-binding NarL/FixJ family response regulator